MGGENCSCQTSATLYKPPPPSVARAPCLILLKTCCLVVAVIIFGLIYGFESQFIAKGNISFKCDVYMCDVCSF